MKRSYLIKVSLALAFFIGIHQYCIRQMGDFEMRQILSDLGNRPEWETESQPIEHLLKQTFTFLDAGDQAYAFLGEDKKTVLKLFKHYDKKGKRPLDHVFASCKLAYDELKEETGLLYLHLNKTEGLPVKLIDKLGFSHTLDINATEYALQQKADDLIFPTLSRLLKKNDEESVKQSMLSLFELIASRCAKGIGDRDTALRRNYGYLNKKPLSIDIGSYFRDERLKDPEFAKEEVVHKTKRLFRWLKKHRPDLLPYYREHVGTIHAIGAMQDLGFGHFSRSSPAFIEENFLL